MRLIKTKNHGYLDLPIGIHLVGIPFISDIDLGHPSNYVPMIIGLFIICYSLLTDYEFGIGPLSMRTHLWLDVLTGGLLAASPWIFNFEDVVFFPHLLAGLFIIALSSVTNVKVGMSQNRFEVIARSLRMQKTF